MGAWRSLLAARSISCRSGRSVGFAEVLQAPGERPLELRLQDARESAFASATMAGATVRPRCHVSNSASSALTIVSAASASACRDFNAARDLLLEVVDVVDVHVVDPWTLGSTLRGTAMSTKKSVLPFRSFIARLTMSRVTT